MAGKRKDVYLVCGGKYHDFDFARLELLKLLAEHDVVRVKVANDYSDVEAMCEADLLVTYTCDEVPDMAGQARLKSYDALVDAARTADDASVGAGAIWIPPGPRLGEEVIVAEGLRKEIGDRQCRIMTPSTRLQLDGMALTG